MTQHDRTDAGDSVASARRLLDLVNSSWMCQAIHVAARLGIADLLAARAQSAEDLARTTGAHAPSLHRLMRALVTIEICREHGDGTFELTPMGALLRADVAGSLRSWTLYWGGSLWPIWGQLLHSVMTGDSAREKVTGRAGFDRDPEETAVFNRAMVELTRLDAASIVQACDFSGMNTIVDVGGGYGELLAAMLAANPAIRGVLFESPNTLENARRHMDSAGVAERCDYVAGDFFESVPDGADAYVLKSVIHDWNDAQSKAILCNCRRAMHEGAKLLLIERIVPERLEPSPAHKAIARGDLNMLVGLGGRERTEQEFRVLLQETGFQVNALRSAGPTFGIVEATRSA